MKRALVISVAIAALGMSALASAQSKPQTRVVVHVTENGPQKWKADMYGGVSFVPSGVTHIVRRETEGWHYLRP